MKKLFLCALLVFCSFLVVGCGNKDTSDLVSQDPCDKYLAVLECLVENQLEGDVQEAAFVAIDARRDQLKALSKNEQTASCGVAWEEDIVAQSAVYERYGCPVN